MSTRPEWADYEALAHEIISELAPHATVTHNDYIVGHQSETRRQIDITVRWKDGDEENLMIIQVKDYRRKASVITVGEFSSVIRDVQAQRGVLICSGGFSKGAVKYARNLGLQLWSLNDARSKKWKDELTIPVLRNRYVPTLKFSAYLAPDVDNTATGGVMVRTIDPSTGETRVTPFDMERDFIGRWSKGDLSFEPGVEHRVDLDIDLITEGFCSDGTTVVNRFTSPAYKYIVTRSCFIAHLKPSEYRGIKDHLDENLFIPSVLEVIIPSRNDESAWSPVSNPSRLAVSLRGTFFVMDDAHIEPSNRPQDAHLEDIGPANGFDLPGKPSGH